LGLITVDLSIVGLAQADDPQRAAPIDEYDAIETATNRPVADVTRLAVIGRVSSLASARVQSSLAAYPMTPCVLND